MALSLIRHDLYIAELFARFGTEIDEAFGPYLRDIRMAVFTPDQIASFKRTYWSQSVGSGMMTLRLLTFVVANYIPEPPSIRTEHLSGRDCILR